jgi:hypothetical protein
MRKVNLTVSEYNQMTALFRKHDIRSGSIKYGIS